MKFVNRNGFPCVESRSISSDGSGTTTIAFNRHNYLITNYFAGGFWIKIAQTLATGTDVIQFTIDNLPSFTTPLYLSTGDQATAADLVSDGNGVHLCFYDRDSNRLQLIA